MAVAVFFEGRPPAGADPRLLARAAGAALGRRFARARVNLVFTADAGIRRLNREFLGRDRVTDVIAFNLPPSPAPAAPAGEIYVCVPQARRQARALGHSLTTELLVLAVHGALHVTGLDDATPAQRFRMNRRTALLLKKLAGGRAAPVKVRRK